MQTSLVARIAPRVLGLFSAVVLTVLVAPRGCHTVLPSAQLSLRPRPWAGFRPRAGSYLAYPLPRPAKVKRDSLGRVVHLLK